MGQSEICWMPAHELAAKVATRELSPVEIVDTCLARIEAVNSHLNAFCFVFPDDARKAAREAEHAVLTNEPLGPLHGVPVAIKDLTPTRGKATTLGSHAYENWVPDHDAAIVEKLRGAGAILVGKTTTPEFAHAAITASPLWGVTRNPWDLSRTPGGSSGGSGAAVAAGCVPLAEGSDMGGSVRIPAACCGVVGLKPSLGRIPMDILPSVFDNISHFGPLARTVDDAALFLSAAQGPDERDIQSLKPGLTLDLPLDGDVKALSFASWSDPGVYPLAPDVAENYAAAVEALRGEGAIVEEVALDWTGDINKAWFQVWGVFMAAYFGHVLDDNRDSLDPVVVDLIERGRAMTAVDYKRIEIVRTEQWQKLAAVLERHDALLCPTCFQTAPSADLKLGEIYYRDDDGVEHGLDMTSPFNFVPQCPAISVPSGFSADGMPTAIQIVGRRYEDDTVLRIAKALELARPWADRQPNLNNKISL